MKIQREYELENIQISNLVSREVNGTSVVRTPQKLQKKRQVILVIESDTTAQPARWTGFKNLPFTRCEIHSILISGESDLGSQIISENLVFLKPIIVRHLLCVSTMWGSCTIHPRALYGRPVMKTLRLGLAQKHDQPRQDRRGDQPTNQQRILTSDSFEVADFNSLCQRHPKVNVNNQLSIANNCPSTAVLYLHSSLTLIMRSSLNSNQLNAEHRESESKLVLANVVRISCVR